MPLFQPHLGKIWTLKLASTITITQHPPTTKEANIWIEALPNQAKQVNMLNMVDNLDAVDKADVINLVEIWPHSQVFCLWKTSSKICKAHFRIIFNGLAASI